MEIQIDNDTDEEIAQAIATAVSERPLPLASSRDLLHSARSASLRERSAPFEFPPDAG